MKTVIILLFLLTNCNLTASSFDEKSQLDDTLYLEKGEKIIGVYDFKTANKVVMYHPESGKRDRFKKYEIKNLCWIAENLSHLDQSQKPKKEVF